MGQRINIQYSIDMDDLDKEVQRLLGTVQDTLGGIDAPMPSEPLSLGTLEHVDTVRRRLAAADYTLQDVTNIISGYLSFRAQEVAPPPEMGPEVPVDEVPPQE